MAVFLFQQRFDDDGKPRAQVGLMFVANDPVEVFWKLDEFGCDIDCTLVKKLEKGDLKRFAVGMVMISAIESDDDDDPEADSYVSIDSIDGGSMCGTMFDLINDDFGWAYLHYGANSDYSFQGAKPSEFFKNKT